MPNDLALQALHVPAMIIAFLFGSVVGSFANVCIARWPHGQSVISPRSRCPNCMTAIAWYDNIPILSWLILGARCRTCKQPISWQYPLVEALTGSLFLLVYLRFGLTPATLVYFYLAAALVIVTFQDLADWTIPDEITLTGIPIGIAVSLLGMVWPDTTALRVTSPFDAIAGACLGGALLFSIDRLTVLILKKPGMGLGDVKLLAMLGAFLGWKGVLGTVFIACLIGSVVGVTVLYYYRVRRTAAPSPEETPQDGEAAPPASSNEEEQITLEGHYLPFGPYLALGGFIYLLIGPEAWQAYLGTMQPEFNDLIL